MSEAKPPPYRTALARLGGEPSGHRRKQRRFRATGAGYPALAHRQRVFLTWVHPEEQDYAPVVSTEGLLPPSAFEQRHAALRSTDLRCVALGRTPPPQNRCAQQKQAPSPPSAHH